MTFSRLFTARLTLFRPAQLFKPFGNLPDEVLHEDTVLPFRSIILSNQLIYIKEPLVKYRLHGNNIFLTAKKAATNLKSLEREEDHLRHDCKHRGIAYSTFDLRI